MPEAGRGTGEGNSCPIYSTGTSHTFHSPASLVCKGWAVPSSCLKTCPRALALPVALTSPLCHFALAGKEPHSKPGTEQVMQRKRGSSLQLLLSLHMHTRVQGGGKHEVALGMYSKTGSRAALHKHMEFPFWVGNVFKPCHCVTIESANELKTYPCVTTTAAESTGLSTSEDQSLGDSVTAVVWLAGVSGALNLSIKMFVFLLCKDLFQERVALMSVCQLFVHFLTVV